MLNISETAKKIGRNISNLLIERDKTQQELADAIGVSKSTVSLFNSSPKNAVFISNSGIFSCSEIGKCSKFVAE